MNHRPAVEIVPCPRWKSGITRALSLAAMAPLAVAACSSNASAPPNPLGGTGGNAGTSGFAGTPGSFAGTAGVGAGAVGPGGVVTLDGGIIVNPPVDPTISFDWPVDNANPSTLSCQAGHYEGIFAGLYTSPITVVGVPIPVTGNVELTLSQSPTGEFFTITDGFVTGRADILAEYRCNFYGTLNCTTKKLENGIIDCGYCVGAYVPEGGICLGLESHFKGPITADYNGASQSFENATWKGKEGTDAGIFGGLGIWTAAYMP